jgi:hypothetical protein
MAVAAGFPSENAVLKWGAAGIALLLAALFAVGFATRHDPGDKPLLAILGGGFIYNYRIAEVHYGFTAVVQKPLESGAIIEARFEDPGGGPPLVVTERVSTMTNQYALQSPPVRGVQADRPYHVDVRVLDREGRTELFATGMDYKSDISDSVVPDKPLTVGPGYHRNPDAAIQ